MRRSRRHLRAAAVVLAVAVMIAIAASASPAWAKRPKHHSGTGGFPSDIAQIGTLLALGQARAWYGHVATVDLPHDSFTINTTSGQTKTFRITGKTGFVGIPGGASGLSAGEHVEVVVLGKAIDAFAVKRLKH